MAPATRSVKVSTVQLEALTPTGRSACLRGTLSSLSKACKRHSITSYASASCTKVPLCQSTMVQIPSQESVHFLRIKKGKQHCRLSRTVQRRASPDILCSRHLQVINSRKDIKPSLTACDTLIFVSSCHPVKLLFQSSVLLEFLAGRAAQLL